MKGIERLRNMIQEGLYKKPLLKIYMYLKTRPDMDKKFSNPEKSMDQMYEYIISQVKKQKVDGVAMVEDAVVYGLAIHYFDESNEDLGIKKEVITPSTKTEKNKIIKPIKIEKPKKEEREQISLFEGT